MACRPPNSRRPAAHAVSCSLTFWQGSGRCGIRTRHPTVPPRPPRRTLARARSGRPSQLGVRQRGGNLERSHLGHAYRCPSFLGWPVDPGRVQCVCVYLLIPPRTPSPIITTRSAARYTLWCFYALASSFFSSTSSLDFIFFFVTPSALNPAPLCFLARGFRPSFDLPSQALRQPNHCSGS